MIVGFSGFGFPKAHGAAFGLLAYQSTWLRVHYGPEFLCALLNEQPMGFYAPDTLVARGAAARDRDAARPTSTRARSSARSTPRRPRPARASATCRARAPTRSRRWSPRATRGGPFRSLGRPGVARGRRPRGARAARVGGRVRRAGRAARRAATALWQLGVAAPGERVPARAPSSRCRSSCPARRRCARSSRGRRWSPTTRPPG